MLTLVPTPIGNLGDITLRAIEVLKNVDLILAEDTRVTRKLLSHLDIQNDLKSFHANNEHRVLASIIESLNNESHYALVTDAGTPGISDPGFLLVRACLENNIKVECLPGATAIIPALVNSGIPCDRFFFEGFLPQKKGRQTRIEWLSSFPYTFVLYESPHRIIKCLKQLIEYCGPDRKASISREITKLYEEVTTDSLAALLEHYEAKTSIKGEIVLTVEGFKK